MSFIDQINAFNRAHQNDMSAIFEAFRNKTDSGLAALETANKDRDQAFELLSAKVEKLSADNTQLKKLVSTISGT